MTSDEVTKNCRTASGRLHASLLRGHVSHGDPDKWSEKAVSIWKSIMKNEILLSVELSKKVYVVAKQ